jgi:hypothetical protein
MPADPRRRLLLAVLAAMALVAAWQFMSTAAPDRPAAVSARRGTPTVTPPPPADVRLESLSSPAAGPGEAERNPFAFGARPAPPAERGPVRAAPAPAPAVFTPTGPPPPPPIPFKFIGLVEGSSGTRIAVLSDSRGLVVHGSEGAIIDGRFRILAIGAETLDIAYADGRGRQTLRLTGQ